MKNIDLTKLTKVELINEIINLTNKCNECIRLRGYLNTHKVLSANTLRTKKRGLRTKINEILEDIHDKNLTRVRIGYCGFRHVE